MDEASEPSQEGAGSQAGEAPTEPATAEVPAAAYPPGYTPGASYGPGFAAPPPGYAWAPPPPGYGWTPPGALAPPPGYAWVPGSPGASVPVANRAGGVVGRLARSVVAAWVVAGALALTVVGLSVALANAGSSAAVGPIVRTPITTPFGLGGGVFGREGVIGTVASVASASFTVTDRSGTTITVDEQSSTTYYNGSSRATSSIVSVGANVVVLGSRSGTTVTATRVIVLPAGGPLGP